MAADWRALVFSEIGFMIALMVISRAAARGGVFEPEHLEILQRVFDQACLDRGISGEGTDAEDLAEAIILLFHAGIVSEAELNIVLMKEVK